MKVGDNFLEATKKQLDFYKLMGEKAMNQVTEEQLVTPLSPTDNSIAVIVKHLHGNMMSRWTDFLHTDGEKPWRDREDEFENDLETRQEVEDLWQEGWERFFEAMEPLKHVDMDRVVFIRNEGHTVVEAIQRQLGHYSYHVGQMVFIAKHYAGKKWATMSIPEGGSREYDKEKFSQEKRRKHFTD